MLLSKVFDLIVSAKGHHPIACPLTPKWRVGISSGYDFKQKGFTYTQLRFDRDLDSWKLDFSWVPFSPRASWNFFIGIKSGLLSDLKYEKRSEPDRSL